jgi:predicted nucleic acid binding AN1-type Zn finger protein
MSPYKPPFCSILSPKSATFKDFSKKLAKKSKKRLTNTQVYDIIDLRKHKSIKQKEV